MGQTATQTDRKVEVPVKVLRASVELGAKTAALCKRVETERAAIEVKAPLVAEALVGAGIVDPLDKKAALMLLNDPVKTLDMLVKVAGMLRSANEKPRPMGTSVTKAASVGFGGALLESDRVLAERLGVSF